jgi:hypothetical protein
MKQNYLRPGRILTTLAEPTLFSSTTARRKHLTLCQTITYKKQTPKFSTIQAIWRTIGAISRAFRVLSESDSRAIRDNWRYFETKHEKFSQPLQ